MIHYLFLLNAAVFILQSSDVTAQLLFDTCLPQDNSTGVFYLPNLSNLGDLSSENIAAMVNMTLSTSETVLYRIPPELNCSGRVSVMEYCYRASIGSIVLERSASVFTLLLLESMGLTFTILDEINVTSTPTLQICTNRLTTTGPFWFCCDSLQLNTVSSVIIDIPSPNFAFGVEVANTQLIPLILIHESQLVERIRFPNSLIDTLQVGDNFNVSNSFIGNISEYRVIQFRIEPVAITEITTSTEASGTTDSPEVASTESQMQPITESATDDDEEVRRSIGGLIAAMLLILIIVVIIALQ